MLHNPWSRLAPGGWWSALPAWAFNSPYLGSGIDISGTAPADSPENQEVQSTTLVPPLLHISPQICQNTLSADPRNPLLHPPSNSPYQGGDLDITGRSNFNWLEPQPITSSGVPTAVLHITAPIEHISAPGVRVRDRSGSPTRGFARGTPNHTQPPDLQQETKFVTLSYTFVLQNHPMRRRETFAWPRYHTIRTLWRTL